MSTGRMLARAAVTAVASLALVSGSGAVVTATAVEVTSTTTATEQCQIETQQVRDARQKVRRLKKKLRKAKRALRNATTVSAERKAKRRVKRFKRKLRAARADLQVQRAERTEWCEKAEQERNDALAAAIAELQKRIAEFTSMQGSDDVLALPTEVSGPMDAAFGDLVGHLETLGTQLPTADLAGLQAALALLQGLDGAALQTAVAALAAEVEGSSDASALRQLLDGLVNGVPGADTGNMDEVRAAFAALAAQLQAFDPATAGEDLPLVTDAVQAALQALQDNATLLESLIEALKTLNGGTVPSDQSEFDQLLGTLLTALAGGGTVEDVVGSLLDPVTDPLDPITDPLTDPLTEVIGDILTGGLLG